MKFIIKNYQIIKRGEIELRPGMTLITGPSNSGKSSIFKAYKQLIYNLSGNTYINQFADQCELILDNDSYTIEYRKTKTKSSYDIKVVNPETTLHIDKLGVNQIDKVKELTHIDKELGYNFWDQLEKPFLLCKTNREQFLLLQQSPISANLLNIQESIKNDIKNLNSNILINQGSLNTITGIITKYEETLKYSAEVQKIVRDMEMINNVNNKIDSLTAKMKQLDNINMELDKIKKVSDIKLELPNIEDIYNKFNYFNNKIAEFSNINGQINSNSMEISKTAKESEELEEIFHKYFNICPLCGNVLDSNV